MNGVTAVILIISVWLSVGCGPAQLSKPEYLQWVDDPAHGLVTQRKLGEFIYKASYHPLEYYILRNNYDISNSAFLDSIKGDYKNFQYWQLEISIDSIEGDILRYKLASEEEYYERVKYFSFDIQKDIYMDIGGKKLPCLLNHFERTYGLSPKISIMLVFEATPELDDAENFALVINDNAFNSGIVKLLVKTENIENIPSLTL